MSEQQKISQKKILRGVTASLLIFAVVSNIFTAVIPTDTTWTHEVSYQRSGDLYTYLYYYDEILGDPNKEIWLADIAGTFDYVYIIAQWELYFPNNNTFNASRFENVTKIIRELGVRGCQSVIHTWYSSYHPTWLEEYVPELKGTQVRWKGMDPSNPHYDILMYSNLQYLTLLTSHLKNEYLSDYIIGFCLDDETSSDNWLKVCQESTKHIHTINANWTVTSMFNNEDRYHMAKNMDYLATDIYDYDAGVVSKMNYAYRIGLDKISLLLNGMDNDTVEIGNRMRRQGWIAWFMGADTIGWWCYNIYWRGYRGGIPNNWFFMPYNVNGPIDGNKSQAIKDFRGDMDLLKQVEAKRWAAINANNRPLADQIQDIANDAYELAKVNEFAEAKLKLQEAINL
jgi:hypothetical protein